MEAPSVLPDKTSDPYIYLKLKNIAVLNTPGVQATLPTTNVWWARQRSDNPDGTDPVRSIRWMRPNGNIWAIGTGRTTS